MTGAFTLNDSLPTPGRVGQRAAGRVSAQHERHRALHFILPAAERSGFTVCSLGRRFVSLTIVLARCHCPCDVIASP